MQGAGTHVCTAHLPPTPGRGGSSTRSSEHARPGGRRAAACTGGPRPAPGLSGEAEGDKREWAGVGAHRPAATEDGTGAPAGRLPEDELAVLQRRARAAALLQEAHLLVEGQVEAPRPKTVPREPGRQRGARPRLPGASCAVSALCWLAAWARPVWPNRPECLRRSLCPQR